MQEEILNIIIVEDDPKQVSYLKSYLRVSCENVNVVGTTGNVDDAYELIVAFKPDLIFLDIELGSGNGIELAQELQNNRIFAKIIIISGRPEYALKAIKLSVVDFIEKPYKDDEISEAIFKFQRNRLLIDYEEQTKLLLNAITKKLILKTKDQNRRIREKFISTEDVVLFERIDDDVSFLKYKDLISGSSVEYPFAELSRALPKSLFFKISKNIIINLKYIYEVKLYNKTCVLKIGPEKIPLKCEQKRIYKMLGLLRSIYPKIEYKQLTDNDY